MNSVKAKPMTDLRGLPNLLSDKEIGAHMAVTGGSATAVVTAGNKVAQHAPEAAMTLHEYLVYLMTNSTPYLAFLLILAQVIYWIMKLTESKRAKRRRGE